MASSVFCERTRASAFSACHGKLLAVAKEMGRDIIARTLTRLFLGCFFSNLLHETSAVLGEPVSRESVHVNQDGIAKVEVLENSP